MEVEIAEVLVVVCRLVLVCCLQKHETVICVDPVVGLCLDKEVCIQHNWENERCRLSSRPKCGHCDLEKGMDLCLECDCLCCLQVVQLLMQQMSLLAQMSLEKQ